MCSLRDGQQALTEQGTVIFGISVDSVESHRRFSDKHKLNFPLLSDAGKETCRAYGTLSVFGFSKRVTFIINPDGRIATIDRDVDVDRHAEQLLQHFQELSRQQGAEASQGAEVGKPR